MLKKILLLTILFLCYLLVIESFANTVEIEINYNLLPELNQDSNTTTTFEIKKLSEEYVKTIRESNAFNNNLYQKLNLFVKNNKSSINSLSAIYMIIGMCLLDETYELYSKDGEKLLDYLINCYPKYIQGKMAIIMKASFLSKKEMNKEAIQLLENNYEVILSLENNPKFYYLLDELNLKENDHKHIMAGYYYYLANFYYKLNNKNNATIYFNKVINQYPDTDFALNAKEKIKKL